MKTPNIDGIEVGYYGAYAVGSDRYPYIVVAVAPKTVTVSPLNTGKNKAQWPNQHWDVENFARPDAPQIVTRRSTKGNRVHYVMHGGVISFYNPATVDPGSLYYLDPSF